MLACFWLLTACQRGEITVHVEVDHGVITHRTNAQTVRNVLAETNITLNDLDRVEPDLYVQIKPEMTIRVIRVTEKTETEAVSIPFEQRIAVNEALPLGEKRLAQLGVNGEETTVTRIVFEDGVEISRTEVSRSVTKTPVEELLIVGGQGTLPTVAFDGIIAYLSGGNAWVMKDNNVARRPLTIEGDLDGRVFSLSADGSTLLYSRTVTDTIDAPLNELWTVSTRIVGEEPISLPVKGVLYAEWSPVITAETIAYSTAERVPSQPGWRSNNDLRLWDINTEFSEAEEIVPTNTNGLYPWWGTTFSWSPDGTMFAYANANEVGVIDAISKTVTSLISFSPYQTNSEWVWVPTVSWSPNSAFIVTTIHGEPGEGASVETNEVFDVWLLAATGDLKVRLWEQAGMWSNPVWYSQGISFGRAITPLKSINSRYKLTIVDWDGSNAQVIFPQEGGIGLGFPEVVWTNNGDDAVFVHENNLYLLNTDGTTGALQLTSDNQSHKPVWSDPLSLLLTTVEATTNTTRLITTTNLLTLTNVITSTPIGADQKDAIRENLID